MLLQQSFASTILFLTAVLLALPLGKYLSKVYKGEKTILDFFTPFENYMYRVCKIDPMAGMDWKQYLSAIFVINSVWFIWGFAILLFQGKLWLNPVGNPSMEWSLAFHSAISFLTSTNLQHYSGESGATYLSQIVVFMFLQFVSAATSLAAGIAVVRGLVNKTTGCLGNFYKDFVLSLTRVLLPLCTISAVLFLLSGVPMTFNNTAHLTSLQGDSMQVATGPVAALQPIKELGSNGGGFFGANDAHPFENPNFFSFIIHLVIVMLIPVAFVFSIGYYLNAKKFSRMIFWVMTVGVMLVTIPIIIQEVKGNPALTTIGINNQQGNIEGKELRYGSLFSAFYSGINMAIPAGTLVAMHDSYLPLGSISMIIGMQVDSFYGGLGTGWINIFISLIVAVFIATMLIGRTPELFGRKISIVEMQVAVGVSLVQAMLPMCFAAIACFVCVNFPGGNDSLHWLSNKGPHGFTTMFYEYVTSMAGNGSNFAGLGNNTTFWNLTTSVLMLFGRFVPIIGGIAIAGSLQQKKHTEMSRGSLPIDSATFGFFLFFVIIILNVLSFFPIFILGPLSEHF